MAIKRERRSVIIPASRDGAVFIRFFRFFSGYGFGIGIRLER
jgi:hypothetical protein